jgi:hypothetical protein
MNEALTYAGLCAAAFGLAAFAPRGQRLRAMLVAATLNLNWWLCAWTYSTYPPQTALGLSATDLWCIFDMSLGVIAVASGVRHWWGWALWFIAIAQECFHVGRFLFVDETYTFWLDKLLLAQVAVFFFIGGRGVYNWLLGIFSFYRLGNAPERRLAKVVRS